MHLQWHIFVSVSLREPILHFEQAGKISATYAIPADPVIDSLYHQSYKEWLLDRISREQRLIWGQSIRLCRQFPFTCNGDGQKQRSGI